MVINYNFKHNVLLSHILSFFQCLSFWGYPFGKHTLNFLLRCVYCAEHSSKKNILQLLVWKCKRNLLFIFFNNSDEARMCFEWSSKKDADFQCNNDVVKRNNLQFFKIMSIGSWKYDYEIELHLHNTLECLFQQIHIKFE